MLGIPKKLLFKQYSKIILMLKELKSYRNMEHTKKLIIKKIAVFICYLKQTEFKKD
jgi:hypothetical protein